MLINMQPDAEPLEATFELNDTLYAKSNISSTDEVYLWLGVCNFRQLRINTPTDQS
jgi:hypothetical protein